VPEFRYPQFCALARAAELLGERWTLLLLRELFVGPQRFSDLRRRLPELSSSVLAERLERLCANDLVRQRTLPPPAASVVYELTDHGAALDEVFAALMRWGVRFLGPPRPNEHLSADWIPFALASFARRGPVPAIRIEIEVRDPAEPEATAVRVRVSGGRRGTRVERIDGERARDASEAPGADVEAALFACPVAVLALASGVESLESLTRRGAVRVTGDATRVDALRDLFDLSALALAASARAPRAPSGDDAERDPGASAPSSIQTRE
jgi:DNA-binding HxlR family transcriptional regulator